MSEECTKNSFIWKKGRKFFFYVKKLHFFKGMYDYFTTYKVEQKQAIELFLNALLE